MYGLPRHACLRARTCIWKSYTLVPVMHLHLPDECMLLLSSRRVDCAKTTVRQRLHASCTER
jgi:hypothetical protein